MKLHYEFPENVNVVLAYYGSSFFAVKSFESLNSSSPILDFHSRNVDPTEAIYFDITLSLRIMDKMFLVTSYVFSFLFSFDYFSYISLI